MAAPVCEYFWHHLANRLFLHCNFFSFRLFLSKLQSLALFEPSFVDRLTFSVPRRTAADVIIQHSVTRLGDLRDFGRLFKAFGNN